jgi:glyoxylate/hydroxypyruvate reductase A
VTLLLAIKPGGGNWSGEAWTARFRALYREAPVVFAGADPYAPADVRYVAAWKPPPGLIAACPNLSAIFNLGAGVDAILADPTVPGDVPLVRTVDADLTSRMTEYVVLHVLDHHRQMRAHRAAQARGEWIGPVQHAARDVRVGLLGLGEIAGDAAVVLNRLGFQVAGWSRTPRTLAGVRCFSGQDGLAPFLARTDILVALLPLTPQTRGILAAKLFKGLARDGVLGRPVLINAGRGGLQVEADILAALDDGTLGGATLDVFETEPLPSASPLWRHPLVTITPHNAADSDPDVVAASVVAQIRALERGERLRNVVDRARGY